MRANSRALVSITSVSYLALGCLPDQRQCDEGLVTGDRLRIDVGPLVSEIQPCDPALGIAPERQLEAVVTAFDGKAGCASAVVMVDNLADWEVTPRNQDPSGSRLVEAHYRIARGECSGSLHLGVMPPGTSVPTPPLDAENAVRLYVSYLPDTDLAGCPLTCDANYRAHVERQ